MAVHPGNGYRVSATWEIRRGGQPSLFLDFDGMAPEGDSCLPLEESYGCQVRGREILSLYFRRVKRSRVRWEADLAAFVVALDA
jgi:hypothetical protein